MSQDEFDENEALMWKALIISIGAFILVGILIYVVS